ncbi:hypothetical protein JCM10212_006915 [Sporobolomyces blumeae]
MDTPLRPRRSTDSPASTPTTTGRPSALESRRALGSQAGQNKLARLPGTPVGRVLAAEGIQGIRSPRRIRHKSLPTKVHDWVSNRTLSLETSIQLLSFDAAGYPLALALNAVHFVVRLPHFYSALPPVASWFSSDAAASTAATAASRYARQAQLDADARLAALQGKGTTRVGTGWFGWSLSVALVLLSVANAAYLASRRRKYQLVLRRDPLSSPNAKSIMLRFTPETPPKRSLYERVKDYVWPRAVEEPHSYPIQELHVWTPDYVLWSLRLFTAYPPPVALMYHFLSPSTFFPFLFVGSSLVFLIFSLVHLYTHLVRDRQILSSETMHEYNSNFVYPRVFVSKRDAGVSTEELEFQEWRKRHGVQRAVLAGGGTSEGGEGGEGLGSVDGRGGEGVAAGSSARGRRGPRESVAVMQSTGTDTESPVPRRRKRHTEMLI